MEAVVSKYEIIINGTKYLVEIGDVSNSPVEVVVNGQRKTVEFAEAGSGSAPLVPAAVAAPSSPPEPEPQPAPAVVPTTEAAGVAIKAPMPGKILSITVKVGDSVSEGDTVCTLEAMKMEMPISSTATGTVRAIHVDVGANVAYDDALVTIG